MLLNIFNKQAFLSINSVYYNYRIRYLIIIILSKINTLNLKYDVKFEYCMTNHAYTFQPDIIDLRKIDQIVSDVNRYVTRDQFIRESLDLMILWWTNPSKTMERTADMWSDFTPTMKDNIREIAPEFYSQMDSVTQGKKNTKNTGHVHLLETSKEIQISRNFLKDEQFPTCKECITNNNPPLMSKLHTRFFSIKNCHQFFSKFGQRQDPRRKH